MFSQLTTHLEKRRLAKGLASILLKFKGDIYDKYRADVKRRHAKALKNLENDPDLYFYKKKISDAKPTVTVFK
ncbi:MAG: hypothetical protein KAH09_07155 [Desulfobacula sp.]|nr:hypothetical protein [Desulfobacula sp.]